MLAAIRRFFAERGVLEVETPLLCRASGTDPNLGVFSTRFHSPGRAEGLDLYLQTSPEFAMKRLLAAGSGPIYQICKAFRNEECGRYHNPEFSLLEWYRVGFSLTQLMDEVRCLLSDLCRNLAAIEQFEHISYRQAFERHTGVDPLTASMADFIDCARRYGFPEAVAVCGNEVPVWLDFLFSHLVQQHLGRAGTTCVFHYPACQPSLAKINAQDPRTVERAEVFLEGIELANGFCELTDAAEQAQRFDRDIASRQRRGLPAIEKDRRFLAALEAGLPDCSGVAVGLDRVLMLSMGASAIDGVLAFPLGRA